MSKARDEHEGIRKDGWEPRLKSSVVIFFFGMYDYFGCHWGIWDCVVQPREHCDALRQRKAWGATPHKPCTPALVYLHLSSSMGPAISITSWSLWENLGVCFRGFFTPYTNHCWEFIV